jgi:hypothetical protein
MSREIRSVTFDGVLRTVTKGVTQEGTRRLELLGLSKPRVHFGVTNVFFGSLSVDATDGHALFRRAVDRYVGQCNCGVIAVSRGADFGVTFVRFIFHCVFYFDRVFINYLRTYHRIKCRQQKSETIFQR